MDIPTLTTRRLTLRAMHLDDWPAYAAMWADPRVTAHIGGAPRDPDMSWMKFCQSTGFWALFGYGYWSIMTAEGIFAGIGGFAQHRRGISALAGDPECGWVFSPDHWGKGLATEAVAAMLAWADAAGIEETGCLIASANVASRIVALRNGYVGNETVPGGITVFKRARETQA